MSDLRTRLAWMLHEAWPHDIHRETFMPGDGADYCDDEAARLLTMPSGQALLDERQAAVEALAALLEDIAQTFGVWGITSTDEARGVIAAVIKAREATPEPAGGDMSEATWHPEGESGCALTAQEALADALEDTIGRGPRAHHSAFAVKVLENLPPGWSLVPEPPAREVVRAGIAGHCVDIDGQLWHEPGQCRDAAWDHCCEAEPPAREVGG